MGVEFRSLTENMDTSTSGGVLIFNIFSALAQFERDLIRERTMAGLKAARARGRKGGRPSKLSDKDIAMIRQLYDSSTVTVQEIADRFDVSRSTIYKALEHSKTRANIVAYRLGIIFLHNALTTTGKPYRLIRGRRINDMKE